MKRILVANLYRGMAFSPKQVEILRSDKRNIAIDGGRRFGKSFIAAAKFTMQVHQRMASLRGKVKLWGGAGMPKAKARHQPPHVEAWVVTPRERHLEQCRAYLQSYYAGQYHRYLHPELALIDGGKQLWLYYGGVAARIRFVVGQSAVGMVSGALDAVWLDEAGLMDNEVMAALNPVLWERKATRICSGTPELGTEHWFTRMCLSGLDPDHPYYVADVVPRDEDTLTVIGTSYDAYLQDVRTEAEKDAKRNGDAWASQWLLGDWRLPSLFVYSEWDPAKHICRYTPEQPMLHGKRLPKPSVVLGVKDWAYSADKPGATVVFHVWYRNPLDPTDTSRPLVIAVEDKQLKAEYTKDGWYGVMKSMRQRYGLRQWYADPSAPDLIRQASNFARSIGAVRPAEKGDKWGRINLVRALLHSAEDMPPAFYINGDRCPNLARQFENYRMATKRSGETTEKTIDYDDHCLDCVAFLMGKVMRGGYSVPDLSKRI